MLARSDGARLRETTKMAEKYHTVPNIDLHVFAIEQANETLKLVAHRHTNGKVLIQF